MNDPRSFHSVAFSPNFTPLVAFSVITPLFRPAPGIVHGDPGRLAQGKWRAGCADNL